MCFRNIFPVCIYLLLQSAEEDMFQTKYESQYNVVSSDIGSHPSSQV